MCISVIGQLPTMKSRLTFTNRHKKTLVCEAMILLMNI
jgi:hypothetical protein